VRKALLAALAFILVAAGWELYKALGPEAGGDVLGWTILPRTADNAMPHVWDMAGVFGEMNQRGGTERVWSLVLRASWYTFRLAFVGLVLGLVIGFGLALLLSRFRIARRGLYPYIIVSQTIPLIAIAPLIASWGGKLQIGSWEWPRWGSVALIGGFLAFFPITVGTLRGLESTPSAALELMRSYAASWGQTFWRVRLPHAAPHIQPALRLAGAAAVIGTLVGEISMSQAGGIGRLIIAYQQQAAGSPARVYAAMFGAAAVGLLMAAVVSAASNVLTRGRSPEATE